MDFEKMNSTNILGGVVQEIGSEGSFDIVRNGNYKYSNIPQEMEVYEDTPGEIYLERERYLLNADEILEEMLGK
ncbi:MAG: hypothetical protein O8C55_07880 [Candidatus Methanoperedens sp.]|nr:hypothetical protein [Candidatus Methanoperedens sp.]